MLLDHGITVVGGVGGRLGKGVGASKTRVFDGSIEALVVVGSLEVRLQVAPCLVGCCLIVSFFSYCREAPCGFHDTVAHTSLFLRCDGVAGGFGKGDTILDFMEFHINRILWCLGRRHM